MIVSSPATSMNCERDHFSRSPGGLSFKTALVSKLVIAARTSASVGGDALSRQSKSASIAALAPAHRKVVRAARQSHQSSCGDGSFTSFSGVPMADFYEIDFLEVHTSKSGDAIGIRYELNGVQYIHVVDGGYLATGEVLADHIDKYYGAPRIINHVVVTHPDQDHAEGLQVILERYRVQALWMLMPWDYVDELIGRFDRFTNPDNLKRRLRKSYRYLAELEDMAKARNIPIYSPFQGARIGGFTVLTPTRHRYLDLVLTSAKTPEVTEESILSTAGRFLTDVAKMAATFIRAAWGTEVFPSDGTSNENEMSVIQFARLCGESIVLTADAGRDGLAEAADYAPFVGLALPGNLNKFQIPHHGGRHNVSTEISNRWFGEPLPSKPESGSESFTAIVSAANEDEAHPRKVVVRGFVHRGAEVISTDDEQGCKRISRAAPTRENWIAAVPLSYPEDLEE